MNYRNLTKEEQEIISKEYGKIKAKDLCMKYDCSIHQIYEIGRKFKKQQKQNKEVVITEKMNQILLSGVLGDGRFKKNGLKNVIYSECHALGELDYLTWKFENLGELTSQTVIYDKNKNNNHNDAKEFTTLTTPSLIPYLNLKYDKEYVIKQLTELGLLLHLLDDGWFAPYTNNKNGRFCICTYTYSDKERELIIEQWKKCCDIDFHVVGVKRKDLGASSSENDKILKLALKYFDKDIDIIKKKFGILL